MVLPLFSDWTALNRECGFVYQELATATGPAREMLDDEAGAMQMQMADIEEELCRAHRPGSLESVRCKLAIALARLRQQGDDLDLNWRLVESAQADLEAARVPAAS